MLFKQFIGLGEEPSKYLLDDYPGAALAYSFRKLRSDYTGNCCVVKRNDGQNATIGWVSDGNGGEVVDLAAIAAHCGTGIGTVRILYNQGTLGSDWDIDGGGTGQSPLIYNNGPLLDVGSIYMDFLQNQDRELFVNASSNFNVNTITVFMRYRATDADATSRRIFSLHNNTASNGNIISVARNTGSISFSQRNPEPQVAASDNTPAALAHTYYGKKDPAGIEIGIDTDSVVRNSTATDNFNVGRLRLGASSGGGLGFSYNGRMQEFIVYDSDQSTNRAAIVADITGYYAS